jgi:hypothetical protein
VDRRKFRGLGSRLGESTTSVADHPTQRGRVVEAVLFRQGVETNQGAARDVGHGFFTLETLIAKAVADVGEFVEDFVFASGHG